MTTGTNPYTTQAISGYNDTPPADDGSVSSANEVTWAKHKTKLGDPIKTLAEAINTQNLAAFAKTVNTDAGVKNEIGGSLALTLSELTIATGSVTGTASRHTIDTESDAASDNLDNLVATNYYTGALLVLSAADTARTVVIRHEQTGAGEFHNSDDASITLDDDELMVVYELRADGDWWEVSRNKTASASIVQVASTVDQTQRTTTSTSLVASGVSATLANNLASTTNDVLILVTVAVSMTAGFALKFQIHDGTAVQFAQDIYWRSDADTVSEPQNEINYISFSFRDSNPGVTPLVYALQWTTASGTAGMNKRQADAAVYGITTMTLMEITSTT